MTLLGSPFTLPTITAALADESEAVAAFFKSVPDDAFFTAPPQVWSPADNLVHLIKSSSPVAMALGLPKFLLRLRFGKAKRPSRTLAQVRDTYVNVALAGGAVASPAFQPLVKERSVAEKERILAKWQSKNSELRQALGKWSEANLDNYVLPHPLLGDMTVREILFFTLYHNMHHVNDVQRLLQMTQSEWFGSA